MEQERTTLFTLFYRLGSVNGIKVEIEGKEYEIEEVHLFDDSNRIFHLNCNCEGSDEPLKIGGDDLHDFKLPQKGKGLTKRPKRKRGHKNWQS